MHLTRRQFFIGGASIVALAWLGKLNLFPLKNEVKGRIVGASSALGHKLRDHASFPEPDTLLHKKIVIIGGGIAGLSAAWKLKQAGFNDFTLLELEPEVGGNASSGENAVSAYPWGAHYVPLLAEESTSARALFEDLGIITGYEHGLPVYNDYYISADPHERLFMYGHWQEGIVPQTALTDRDKQQYHDFFAAMEHYKTLVGGDGKKAFAIPVDKSSDDPQWRALDRLSMAEYLAQQGWDSPYLKWYVDYCCRDDYGANAEDISAWAGIHYFAGRSGKAANADAGSVITWPEGNGWIVKQLRAKLTEHLRTQSLVYQVTPQGKGAEIRVWDTVNNRTTRIIAGAVLFATPRFVAQRLLQQQLDLSMLHYSPWMVANVTLSALPQGKGTPLAWDNMIYDSKLLGYVVATHQNLNRVQNETVLTYYWPLSHLLPKDARQWMIAQSYETWRDTILDELLRIHPELDGHVRSLDVWLWGHGMIRPTPNYIWGIQRAQLLQQHAPFFHAHSDMSGVSIFEEANYHGVAAAEAMLTHFNHSFESSL